jgi:hypothetical protein
MDKFFEDATAMLVIFKLVKAGAGRRQRDHIAGWLLQSLAYARSSVP